MHSVFSRGAYFSLDSLFSTRQRVNAAIMSSSPGSSPDENHSSSRSGTRPNSTPIESSSHSVKHKRREVRRQRECCRKLITQGSKPWYRCVERSECAVLKGQLVFQVLRLDVSDYILATARRPVDNRTTLLVGVGYRKELPSTSEAQHLFKELKSY
ncbi:hypothetical protein BDZ89DRAFT_571137 [Hymenopellis radicata]|nr:hypothetical protein BDZ89DRAFT_571137 [Hymenopellis radicata]